MTPRLIVLDLDGTLLSSRKEISPENRAALGAAAAAGAVLVPASGRSYLGIPAAVRALPLFRYFITCNGASVYDRAAERELCSAPIPLPLARAVLARLRTIEGSVDFYGDGFGFIEEETLARLDALGIPPRQAEYIRATRRPVPSLDRALETVGAIHLMQILLRNPAEKPARLAALQAEFPALHVLSSIPNNVELNSREATKGNALRALCRILSLSPADAAAFGDEENDLPMLRAAGLGIAMGNASPAVRAAANRVTGTNDENGVAAALRELFPISQTE